MVTGHPRLVVLAERWPVGGPGWSTGDDGATVARTMAAALALEADVHVVIPGARRAGSTVDGAFTVHELGTAPDRATAVRRALLVDAVVASDRTGPLVARARSWLRGAADVWDGLPQILGRLQPEAVVITGHRHVGILEEVPDSTPIIGVPLCTDAPGLGHPIFDPVLDRAVTVLNASAAECRAVAPHLGDPARAHDVGLVVPVNPSVVQEPATELAGQDYILVLGADADLESQRCARLLAMRFGHCPVVVAGRRHLVVWRGGEASSSDPVSRHIDLWRLMAWARCTVDLRPGALLPLRSIESLQFSTPVVVPEEGRARQVVEDNAGGLWYGDAAELLGCVDALLEDRWGKVVGQQGGRRVALHYAARDAFVARVRSAVAEVLPS